MMIRLNNDYSEGCHPSILLRLNEMNLEQNPGLSLIHISEPTRP